MNLEGPAVNSILEGSFQSDTTVPLFPETTRIIKRLGTPLNGLEPLPVNITKEEFQANYRIVKERTSSSVSGRHVGHYKAAVQDDTLSTIHSTMMSIPYKVGFSPERWRRVLARRLSHRMEDGELIPDMQYGSRPGKLCITPVLNKQLTHNIIIQTKRTAAIIENDAVGCYDRLMNPLLLLAMRWLGVPESLAKTLAYTWSQTSHSIKTAYGISKVNYQNTPNLPLFGPGQGSTVRIFTG
jgi:hypothetical protein